MLVLVSGGSRAGPGGLESSLILGESKKKKKNRARKKRRQGKQKKNNKQTNKALWLGCWRGREEKPFRFNLNGQKFRFEH